MENKIRKKELKKTLLQNLINARLVNKINKKIPRDYSEEAKEALVKL